MSAIANLARDCMTAYEKLLRFKQDRGDEATEVENDLFQFRLWAHNNAVLSQERDSMDHRLRRATVPHSVMTDLLKELLQAILHRMKADGDSASSVITSPEMTDLLSQLSRLTRAIRRASGPQRLMRAANYVEWYENKFDGTKINLTAKFRELVKLYLDATLKLPNSPVVDTDQLSSHEHLKERLLHTICIRQSTFALLKSRRKELNQDLPPEAIFRPAATVSKASSQVSVRSTSSSHKKQKPQIPVNSGDLAPIPGSVVRSGSTLASTAQINPELHTESTIETGVELAYLPRRPKLSPDRLVQRCPYCLELCPRAEFGDDKWPIHVLQDLMPYVCMLDNCPRPHAMYESRKSWTTHMNADHAVHGWTCMDGHHRRPELFENKQAFIEHISRHQNGTLNEEEIAEAVEDCHGVLASAFFDEHCPLCGFHLAGADGDESVEDHVAEHLLFLSQVGLEPLEGIDMESVLGLGSRDSSLLSQAAQYERSGLSSISIANSTGLEETSKSEFEEHKNFQAASVRSHSSDNTEASDVSALPDVGFVDDEDGERDVAAPDVPIADASREQSSAADSLPKAIEKAIEDLASAIYEAFCENSKNESFLPIDKLSKFVKEEQIDAVIGRCVFFHDMEDVVRFVQEDARRLFLTLVMMESKALEQELKYFQDMGFDDRVLPISLDRDYSAYILREPSNTIRYLLPSKWKRTERLLFEEYQRRFTIPVFGTPDNFHHHIPEGQRLPYLEVAPRPASNGYFGEVSKNIIHAKHIHPSIKLPVILWTSNKPTRDGDRMQIESIAVAIKKTRDGDENSYYNRAEFFDREVGNLERLQDIDSPHLIKPISVYHTGQERCLMFPWAEGGNLRGYWQDFPLQARNRSHVLWQLRQFVGICSALTELHDRTVRHGDLKPENILWFDPKNDGGILQIADLGLATFHQKEEDTRPRRGMPTPTSSGTSRYEPPEMDKERNSLGPWSRQADIWSFGCIVFELLLWLAYGPSDITIFRNNTPYFWQKHHSRGKKEYVVHEYVVAIMETLDRDLEPGTAYKDLLNLVRNRLLVIKYSANYNDVPDDCREGATKVHEYFAKIVQRCEFNSDYLKPLTEKLRYPEAELDGKATHRNGVPRNEVHEKGGNPAVPGQHSHVQHALHSNQMPEDIAQITQSGISDPDQDIPVIAIRAATMDLNSGSLTPETSQVSNHQEDVSSYDAREES